MDITYLRSVIGRIRRKLNEAKQQDQQEGSRNQKIIDNWYRIGYMIPINQEKKQS